MENGNEDKQTRNLVSFDPANLEICLKYFKGMFNPNAVWHSYFLIPWSHFTEKERNRWRHFFLQL